MTPEQPIQGKTLLLVDDSEVTREVLGAVFEAEGYGVVIAESGEQALGILAVSARKIDLVLLDLVMPMMDGYETLRRLREIHPRDELPVVVVTAEDHPDSVLRAYAEGADDYLVKPITDQVSLSKIAARLQVTKPRPLFDRDVQCGEILGRKYRLDELIGTGGFGTVFRATHIDLDATVALKVLHQRIFGDPNAKLRLRTEGRALARLDHPNTVRVWDLETGDGVPFLVMEFLEGNDLAEELSRRERLSLPVALLYLHQLASGLAAAHAISIHHRDIKPQNIFLQVLPRGSRVKLLDFGLAALAEGDGGAPALTQEGEMVGSPRYVAPERITSTKAVMASDIYSLGIVAFEILTGEFPYPIVNSSLAELIRAHAGGTPRSVRDLRDGVPDDLVDLVDSMIERDPARRPTAPEIRDRVGAIRETDRSARIVESVGDREETQADTEPVDLQQLSLDL